MEAENPLRYLLGTDAKTLAGRLSDVSREAGRPCEGGIWPYRSLEGDFHRRKERVIREGHRHLHRKGSGETLEARMEKSY